MLEDVHTLHSMGLNYSCFVPSTVYMVTSQTIGKLAMP